LADTAAALLIQMGADISALRKELGNAVGVHQSAVNKMVRQQKEFESTISGSFKKIGEAATAYLSFEAIKGWTESITENIMGIQRQSQALGISTTVYQGLSILAKKADIDQQALNTGLDKFASNIGQAQLKVTPFSKLMKQLGVSIKGVSVQDAFFKFLDALEKLPNLDAKLGVLRNAFGGGASGAGASAALAGFLSQGSGSIEAQIKQLEKVGEIAPTETVEKIVSLDKAMIDLKATLNTAGASAITGFVDEFDKFQKGISGKDFQTSLANVGRIIADIVGNLPAMAKHLPAITGALVGGRLAGIPGAVGGAALGGVYENRGLLENAAMQIRLPLAQQQVDYLKRTHAPAESIAKAEAVLANTKQRLAPTNNDSVEAQRYVLNPGHEPFEKESGGTGKVPNLDAGTTAYETAVRALNNRMAALKTSTGEFADYTQATEAATAKTQLLSAAESDAAKAGTVVSKTQIAAIDALSSAYGRLAADRSWSKDLSLEDDRITKLQAEAAAADRTAASIAEIQEKEKLLADFHKTYGQAAVPNATQLGSINSRAKAVGDATGLGAFNQALKGADQQIFDLGTQTKEVGLYNGALAETAMRLDLYHQAALAGHALSQDELADIDAKSKAYGALTDHLIDLREKQDNALQLTGALRDGLSSIGEAGVTGFKSMESAAAGFLQQIAQLIIKLYVMQPILDSLFGKQGTAGGGLFGGLLGGLFGGGSTAAAGFNADGSMFFGADGGYTGPGGKNQFAGYVHKGEIVWSQADIARSGGLGNVEALRRGYANGGIVDMPMPAIARATASTRSVAISPVFNVDARGAQLGVADQISVALRQAAPGLIAASVSAANKNLPGAMRKAQRDYF
jgi:hypothetical protein